MKLMIDPILVRYSFQILHDVIIKIKQKIEFYIVIHEIESFVFIVVVVVVPEIVINVDFATTS